MMPRKKKLLLEKLASLFISVIVLTTLLTGASLVQRGVVFPDKNLEYAIREKLDNHSEPISRGELLQITHLEASGYNITSLKGIEGLTRLEYLELENNMVADLEKLSELSRLVELNLRSNLIEDIRPLADLNGLRILDLRGNQIADLAPLAGLNNLTKLNLRENEITDITPLSNLTNLTYLNLHSNENISSLSALANLSKLETLILRNVDVQGEVSAIKEMTKLEYINLRNTNLISTEPIGMLLAEKHQLEGFELGHSFYLDIRDNPLPGKENDPYAPLRSYWPELPNRLPYYLPMEKSIEPPIFSHKSGFFDEDFHLEMKVTDPGVEIYYTLDGSRPDPNDLSKSYQVMQTYPDGTLEDHALFTHSYDQAIPISVSYVPDFQYELINTGYRNNFPKPLKEIGRAWMVRAVAYDPVDELSSEVVTKTYFPGNKYLSNDQLLLVSIVSDPVDLFDYTSGIYVAGKVFNDELNENPAAEPTWCWPKNYMQRGREWERPAYIEIYDSPGEPVIAENAGIRISGNSTRNYYHKSLRVYARPEYGSEQICYSLFSGEVCLNRFILRNAGQDCFDTFMADALSQLALREFPVDFQDYRPAVLYLNGVYWGLVNARERYDQYYFYNKYRVAPEDLVILANEELHHGQPGDVDSYLDMAAIQDVESLFKQVDLESFTFFNIGNLYLTHSYWPNSGTADNMYWKKRVENSVKDKTNGSDYHDGRWRYIWKDMDKSFEVYDHNMFDQLENMSDSIHYHITKVAWSDDRYLKFFLNTLADSINTTFHPKTLHALIDDINNVIAEERAMHYIRWQSGDSEPDKFRDFADKRPAYFLQHAVDYFGLSGYDKLIIKSGLEHGVFNINSITITADCKTVNEDGTWEGFYFEDVPITLSVDPEEGHRFSHWKINGELYYDNKVTLHVDEETVLEAYYSSVFR